DLIEPMVAIGKHGTPLERSTRLPAHPVAARHRDLGRTCGAFDVAAFDRPLEVEIVAPMLVNEHRTTAHVTKRVDHRTEHLVIDRDRCSQVLRLGPRRSDAGSDSLTDIAHLIGCQWRPSW